MREVRLLSRKGMEKEGFLRLEDSALVDVDGVREEICENGGTGVD